MTVFFLFPVLSVSSTPTPKAITNTSKISAIVWSFGPRKFGSGHKDFLRLHRSYLFGKIYLSFPSFLYPTILTDFSIRWHDGTVVEHVMSMHPRMSSIGQDEAKL